MPDAFAIETEHLGRTYRPRRGSGGVFAALTDVTLQVSPGELFGLLGPNGAGKTTLIKILTTLLSPTTGAARVAGHDVSREPHLVRPRINMVSGGESSGYGLLTVRENLWMFAQFYGLGSADANRRIRDLLDIVKMGDRLNTKCTELSTGLRQKMNIVRGFLTDPDVLFLDEPSLGLDVGASHDVRGFVRRWMDEDRTRTLLLTTHDMVEADALCDRVAIINGGRVLACDTPAALKRGLHRDVIFHLETTAIGTAGASALSTLPGVVRASCRNLNDRSALELILKDDHVLGSVMAALDACGARLLNLAKREPTLEDVFVTLVGRRLDEADEARKVAV